MLRHQLRRRGTPAATLAASAVAACHTTSAAPAASPALDRAMVGQDIAYLASDQLEGRGTGTAGNDSAAAYIARRLSQIGLQPVVQPFVALGKR